MVYIISISSRRPLITREKFVHHVAISKVDAAHYLLQIVTQAGTYLFTEVQSNERFYSYHSCIFLTSLPKAIEFCGRM